MTSVVKVKEANPRRKLLLFWLRLICFCIILGIILAYTSYVLTPKYEYGIGSMLNLYFQKRDTVDVLVLGTSLAYDGVNNYVLWAEYGIASYNLCSAEQPYWNSYYYLLEALKTQSPKLIILDAKPSSYKDDYQRRGRIILNTYGILSPFTRIGAIAASSKPDEFLSYMFALPQLHSFYKNLSADDFQFPPENNLNSINWKGFIGMDEHESHSRPSLVWTDTQKPMNEKQEEYLLKIFQVAVEQQIPVLLVAFPNPDYANDHMYYNSLWSIAEENNVEYINFNNPDLRFGLRYTTDFADWQHLNVRGSIILSRELGKKIKEMYELPDHRGNLDYISYNVGLEQWQSMWDEYTIPANAVED